MNFLSWFQYTEFISELLIEVYGHEIERAVLHQNGIEAMPKTSSCLNFDTMYKHMNAYWIFSFISKSVAQHHRTKKNTLRFRIFFCCWPNDNKIEIRFYRKHLYFVLYILLCHIFFRQANRKWIDNVHTTIQTKHVA